VDGHIYKIRYLQLLEEGKIKKGFSISIKGAGTKEQIITSLQTIICDLESRSVEELQQIVEFEDSNLTCETDTFESYTGYSIEEEDEQQ
jgi:hypothetical protein